MEKTAIVTGSAKGLGKYLAVSLANEGFRVALHFNTNRTEADKTISEVKKKSPDSVLVQADLTKEGEVNTAFGKILKDFRSIDLLVNNVGNFIYKKFSETTNREFKDILESNILSSLYCSRAVLRGMKQNRKGHIINMGTVGADVFTIREKSATYFMAKNGLYNLTKIMAWEEAGYGIHINMISPASMAEDIFDAKQFPMGRSASYEDVYKTLRFLISEDAYYINGANIEVAGAFIPGLAQSK
ncbi:MAG: hypothetical protein COU81_01760 [Candidatus Portnoybacteria bacterium CG10_big_fil_rev_8_21_14_0_10_36_7]|uniref:Beta-ketoacyl-ACP reductase n=1 Tax=Candidatus Portnoybacteria bacterium CG10_big_fil_rev_8_21_14_0_10_36_7 TaxID=1974812 RepID=A0A2M8KEA0_9BACT|nr:MAG: hypothetical protein COU81_01760 [Candidatus Portnoybacteria bacterium CG10_big_fil_rev_8_21_14_0_10_36_7]